MVFQDLGGFINEFGGRFLSVSCVRFRGRFRSHVVLCSLDLSHVVLSDAVLDASDRWISGFEGLVGFGLDFGAFFCLFFTPFWGVVLRVF